MKNRTTLQKQVIYNQIKELHNHPTADEVYAKIRLDLPKISRATVYRNLNELAFHGKIIRVKVPNSADRYDHTICKHSHIYCTTCQRLMDINAPVIEAPTRMLNGFKIDEVHVTYTGVCPKCLAANRS